MRSFKKSNYWAGAVVALLFGALILGIAGPTFAQADRSRVVMILEVRGVIDPIVAQYVKHDLDTAHSTDTELVILLLDTPGGLDTAVRDIVQPILNSDLPIAVYVEPSGARAASAGVFIIMKNILRRALWIFDLQPSPEAGIQTNLKP